MIVEHLKNMLVSYIILLSLFSQLHYVFAGKNCTIKMQFQEQDERIKFYCPSYHSRAVDYLFFEDSSLPVLQEQSLALFTHVSEIHLSNTGLHAIERGAFEGLLALEELYLNENRISELKRGSLSIPKLKSLDLSKNNLSNVEERTFNDLISLQALNLSYNNFVNITRWEFQSLHSLEILDLSHNHLVWLDPQALSSLQLQRIFLNNNKLSVLTFDNFTNVEVIDASFNELTNITIHAALTHKVNLNNNLALWITIINITSLDMSNNELTGFRNFFEYTQELTFRHNKITRMKSAYFVAGKYVKTLDVSYNIISKIDRYSFRKLQQLHMLNLSHNSLTHLDFDVFSGLTDLQELYLSHNQIQVLYGIFRPLANLKILDLSHNGLKEIGDDAFLGLASLQGLDLSFNSVTEIHASSFRSFVDLEVVDLSHNGLNSVDSLLLQKLKKMKLLVLRNNKLEKLELKTEFKLEFLDVSFNMLPFARLYNIKQANASHNRLESFLLSNQTEVFEASFNQISTLYRSSFVSATELKKIDLSNNMLSEINQDTFENVHKLTILNLSRNALTDVKFGTFDSLTALESLDVSYNKFVFLYQTPGSYKGIFQFNHFEHFGKLKNLIIDYNPWSCEVFHHPANIIRTTACQNYIEDSNDLIKETEYNFKLISNLTRAFSDYFDNYFSNFSLFKQVNSINQVVQPERRFIDELENNHLFLMFDALIIFILLIIVILISIVIRKRAAGVYV